MCPLCTMNLFNQLVSLAKPSHAIEHFRVDLITYRADVAIAEESCWLKRNTLTPPLWKWAGEVSSVGIGLTGRKAGGNMYCRTNQLLCSSIFVPRSTTLVEWKLCGLQLIDRDRDG